MIRSNGFSLCSRRAIVCTYGDTMRVPASGGVSLLQARAEGADVRVIASPADASIEVICHAEPNRRIIAKSNRVLVLIVCFVPSLYERMISVFLARGRQAFLTRVHRVM